jgi:hypothetical protein
MAKNNNSTLNTTELMTGKDGKLFVEVGEDNVFLAEINTYSVVMNVNSTEYQGVGSILVGTVPTGVTFDLTFTEAVIRDDVIMAPLIKAIGNGYVPTYNFQGKMVKPDGSSTETITFKNAIPNGSFGIQNLTPGEVVTREHSYRLNSIPSIIKQMAAT